VIIYRFSQLPILPFIPSVYKIFLFHFLPLQFLPVSSGGGRPPEMDRTSVRFKCPPVKDTQCPRSVYRCLSVMDRCVCVCGVQVSLWDGRTSVRRTTVRWKKLEANICSELGPLRAQLGQRHRRKREDMTVP
jgi:hypothetical protein